MPVTGRAVPAAVLLVVGAALAVLAVLVHYGFMAMYGGVSEENSRHEEEARPSSR